MRAPTSIELEAEIMRRSFRRFVEGAWPLLEPAQPFVPGTHIDALIKVVEAVTAGEVNRVIVNIPPRYGKSTQISVLWPAWAWISAPELRSIFGSYSTEFASHDSVRTRRLIESEWYRERWGNRFALTLDQNTKFRFENDRTGVRLAQVSADARPARGRTSSSSTTLTKQAMRTRLLRARRYRRGSAVRSRPASMTQRKARS